MRNGRVLLFVAVGLLAFSLSAILVRLASEAPGVTVAVWRTLFAVAFLTPFALGKTASEVRRLSGKEWGLITFAGILLGLHFVVWIESIYHTTVASASVLFATNPIFIAILGFWILRERLHRRIVIAIVIAVGGAFLIALGDSSNAARPNAGYGNMLALSSAFVFACYLLIGRVVRRQSSWLAYVYPLYVVVAVTVVVYALATGTALLGFDMKIYALCALMALGPQIIGHGSFNYAVRYVPAAILGAAGLVEPVLAGIWAWLLFDEVPAAPAVVGALVVLAALGMIYYYRLSLGSGPVVPEAESTSG
ncbi:MAG TPA: DMT family transporter [Rhodothermales bacterium]